MKLKKNSGGGAFTPHPETDAPVRGVIVDVTPLREMTSSFGTREVFKLVYETEVTNEDDKPFCVWSRPYTPSLHEKAAFRKDLKKILGRDLTKQEEDEFDTESLLGMPVNLMVEHTTSEKGDVYANIALLTKYKGADPLEPSGNYIRVQDREEKASGTGSSYRKAAAEEDAGREDWQKTKVHVGAHAGVELGDLEEPAVERLIEKWLPQYEANPKPTAADKRLAAALAKAQELLAATSGGDF